MDKFSIMNEFDKVDTPNLTEEQKHEIAELLERFLNSRLFADSIADMFARYGSTLR